MCDWKYRQELFVVNGTSKVRNHLEQKHQIDSRIGIRRKASTQKSVLDQQKDSAASSVFFLEGLGREVQRAAYPLDCILPHCLLSIGESVFSSTTLLLESSADKPPTKGSEDYLKLGNECSCIEEATTYEGSPSITEQNLNSL